ncbi:MAG: SDR family NAD(P)-dependent oxidoreductase [Undibacterium sp.]|nr:SDR family NAD(P)-dependent oxidoreductase [Opitutaceae bacterium]
MKSTRTVLITGASSGIGLELARCFARDGDALVLTGRDPAALAATAEDLRRAHAVTVTTFAAELGTDAGITTLLGQIAAAKLEIDVLVNNAGFGVHGNFLTLDATQELALTTVHLSAPWRLTKALLPAMVARGRGGVLNIGSIYSFSPAPWQALYGAAKSWLLSFSLSLREELHGTGVNVTILCPGTTLSRFRTRTGHRDRPSWFTQTSLEVAVAGHRGFRRGRALVVPGVASKFYVFGARVLPTSWLGRYVYYTAYRLRGMPAPRLSEGKKS